MYPLPFPSFPNSLGNSFSFLFSLHLAQFNHLSSSVCVMQIWAAETEPISPSAHELSRGADRKDEFFRLNVPPFFTQLHGIKATFLRGALVYFSPLHSASPVVKCMNKDRESHIHHFSASTIMDTLIRIGKDDSVRRGFIFELKTVQISSPSVSNNFLFKKEGGQIHWLSWSGFWLTASPEYEQGWG